MINLTISNLSRNNLTIASAIPALTGVNGSKPSVTVSVTPAYLDSIRATLTYLETKGIIKFSLANDVTDDSRIRMAEDSAFDATVTETAAYTILPTDKVIFWNGSAPGTITLPLASTVLGKKFVVRDISGAAATTATPTLACSGSDNLLTPAGNVASKTLTTNYGTTTVLATSLGYVTLGINVV